MCKFKNSCDHAPSEYAGEFEGQDLYFFFDTVWRYCLRRSSRTEDYHSWPIEALAQRDRIDYHPVPYELKFERIERIERDLALIHRFFEHTSVHLRPTSGWRVLCEDRHYYIFATTKVFPDEQAAADYAGTVNPNRNPIVIQI